MAKTTKNILSLNHKEVTNFFMKSEQYHGFELPEYFTFDEILKYVRETIGDAPYEKCAKDNISPNELSDVNLDILLNKDGRYAVRPIMLANPFLYYFLVREVCNEENWAIVKELFDRFKVPHITSCAIPIIPREKEAFHKATTINNWWNSMEQRSIELSLEYRYMFVRSSKIWAILLNACLYQTRTITRILLNIKVRSIIVSIILDVTTSNLKQKLDAKC